MADARHFLVHRDTSGGGPPDFYAHTADLFPGAATPSHSDTTRVTPAAAMTDNTASKKPDILNVNHQDSIFANAFGSRAYYTVNPEWVSETVSNPQPEPLHRPPWPWEQPRYRVNMQVPITYKSPDEGIPVTDKKKELEKEEDRFCQEELPPISYQLSQMYKSTHPPHGGQH